MPDLLPFRTTSCPPASYRRLRAAALLLAAFFALGAGSTAEQGSRPAESDALRSLIERDPEYWQREELEAIGTGSSVGPITQLNGPTLEALKRGELRIRQRPGPKNVLGGVKFVLPNSMDIYLHGTSSQKLFDKARRDLSHGCIRVADPQALAAFVLRDQPEWTAERINEAMTAGKMSTVKLAEPLPVVVLYTTAMVDTDGKLRFAPDIYGYDRKLKQALDAR